jgi:formylglycine-generating enzyme required for sulfatase activity
LLRLKLRIAEDYGADIDSYPTYATLRRFLRVRFDHPFLRDGDNLWFFFAGHGIRHEDRDYLMPIDGDPGDVANTAIPLHYVTERLSRSGADNVILLVDACRAEGRRAGLGVGQERQQGVITLFSCSPREASYEIDELQHGAFTHVLLEGLRLQEESNCATVERLYQYLQHYVPQIAQRYKQVQQTPYGRIEPPNKNHLILLPRRAYLSDIETLKKEAALAEARSQRQLARQLWIRVWGVSPADPEAIEGIERLARSDSDTVPPILTTPPEGERRAVSTPVPPEQPPAPTPQAEPAARSESSSPPPAAAVSQPVAQKQPPAATPQRPQSPTPRPSLPSQSPAPPGRTGSAYSLGDRMTRRKAVWIIGGAAGIGTVLAISRLASETPEQVPSPPEPTATPESISPSPTTTPDPAAGGPSLTAADFMPSEVEVVTVNAKGEIANRETKQAQVFKQSIGATILELVAIPGGTFTMGSPGDEKGRSDNEGPQHQVTVPAFLMGKYQVTQAQWRAVANLPKVDRDLNPDPSLFNGDNRPVEQVSWDDAVEFCKRLSKAAGRGFRLASEAEWEYACRAGTDTPFHFGPTITPDLANYNGNRTYGQGPKGIYRGQTTEVGSFPANAFGLYDMHGNVWEWCLDHWHDNYRGAPTDGRAWTTGGDSSRRLLRGGSWVNDPDGCRSAYRSRFTPGRRLDYLGFRVVCVSSWTL